MALLNKLKRLFGLEKPETIAETASNTEPKEEPSEQSQNPTTPPTPERDYLDHACGICNQVIARERRKKIGGKWYHRTCFKEKYKQLKAQGKAF